MVRLPSVTVEPSAQVADTRPSTVTPTLASWIGLLLASRIWVPVTGSVLYSADLEIGEVRRIGAGRLVGDGIDRHDLNAIAERVDDVVAFIDTEGAVAGEADERSPGAHF